MFSSNIKTIFTPWILIQAVIVPCGITATASEAERKQLIED
jgi:hypothetical protein